MVARRRMSNVGHGVRTRTHSPRNPTSDRHGSRVDGGAVPLWDPAVDGLSFAEARDGEQTQTPDLMPQAVETGHFERYARAPGVNNNPWIPEDAEVVIDETGIHIENGKLFLTDLSGASVLGPAGFSGSWAQFLASGGVYNSEFSAGTLGAFVTSEQGSGATTADYQGSLSAQLPYWIVAVANGTLALVSDSAASFGRAVESAATVAGQTNVFYQDIAVQPAQAPLLGVRRKVTVTTGSVDQDIYASYRDSDHGLIGVRTLVSGTTVSSTPAFSNSFDGSWTYDISAVLGNVPAEAAYVRVEFEITHNSTAGQTWRLGGVSMRAADIDVASIVSGDIAADYIIGSQIDAYSLLKVYDLKFGTSFANGDTSGDVQLSRGAANRLDLASGDDFRIVGGALQFGSDVVLARPSAGVLELATGDTFKVETLDIVGRPRLSNVISPPQITATQNDYAPTGYATANTFRIFSDAARAITGIVAGEAGDIITLMNTGGFTITLQHQNAGSTAANRIVCPSGATFNLVSNGMVQLIYDGVSDRWRVLST